MLFLCCRLPYFYFLLFLSGMHLHAMPILEEKSEKSDTACASYNKSSVLCLAKNWKMSLNINHLNDVQELLNEVKIDGFGTWLEVGLALGLKYAFLRSMERDQRSDSEHFTEVLSSWLNKKNMKSFDDYEQDNDPKLYDLIQGFACIELAYDTENLIKFCGKSIEYDRNRLVKEYLLRYRKAVKASIDNGKALSTLLDDRHLFMIYRELFALKGKALLLSIQFDVFLGANEWTNNYKIEKSRKLLAVVELWLKKGGATRQALVGVLKRRSIQENRIATNLEERYTTVVADDDEKNLNKLWSTLVF